MSGRTISPFNLVIALDNQKISGLFRLIGWGGFWIQLVIAIVASIFLFIAVLNRNVDREINFTGTGIGIALAICSILVLNLSTFLSFRYTRFARNLRNPNPALQPSRRQILGAIYLGLIASIIGMVLTLVGAEVSDGMLLARAISQPQSNLVYDPNKIIRVLDILVVLVNITLAGVHLLGNITSLWLLKQLDPFDS